MDICTAFLFLLLLAACVIVGAFVLVCAAITKIPAISAAIIALIIMMLVRKKIFKK